MSPLMRLAYVSLACSCTSLVITLTEVMIWQNLTGMPFIGLMDAFSLICSSLAVILALRWQWRRQHDLC